MTIKFSVLMNLTNMEKNLVVRKVNHLVYLSEVLMVYLEVTLLELIYAMITRVKSEYLNDILKD